MKCKNDFETKLLLKFVVRWIKGKRKGSADDVC